MKKKLSAVFGRSDYLASFQTCINARPRKPEEPIAVYAAAITTLVEEAFPSYGSSAKEGEKFRRFVAGFSPFLQVRVHELGAKAFQEAVDIAIRVERAHVMGQSTQNLASHTTVATVQESDVLECILLRLDEMEKTFKTIHLHPSPSRSRSPTSDQRYDGWRNPTSRHRSPPPERRQDTWQHDMSQHYADGYRRRSPSPDRRSHYPPPPGVDNSRSDSPSFSSSHDPRRVHFSQDQENRY